MDKLSYIFYYLYNDIGYNNRESVHFLHVHLLHWFYYSIHSIRVVALAALSSLAALGVVTLTPPGPLATAGLASRPSISVPHFCVYFDRAGHFITSNCISELMIFMCVYAYMYVLYVIPQYYVFIVYINPITTFILYIITFYSMFYAFYAFMFYCTLSEMARIKMINQSLCSVDLY